MSTWPNPGGPYDVDEREYHADRTALSSSGARTLTKYCPARYLEERNNGRPDTAAFDHGHAAHTVILGTGMPIAEIVDEPDPRDEEPTAEDAETVEEFFRQPGGES